MSTKFRLEYGVPVLVSELDEHYNYHQLLTQKSSPPIYKYDHDSATAKRVSTIDDDDDDLDVNDHVEDDGTCTTTSSDDVLMKELDDIQMIHGILTEEELKYYNGLLFGDKATLQHGGSVPGRINAPAIIQPELRTRIQNLLYGDDNSDSEELSSDPAEAHEEEAISQDVTTFATQSVQPLEVTVSKITKPLPIHKDYRTSNKSPMTDHVAFISLIDSHDSHFVWGDTYALPLTANTMYVFRGNYTHGIPDVNKDGRNDEVRFLGPFAIQNFEQVGSGDGVAWDCLCSVACNEKVFVFDDDAPNVGYDVEVKCDEGFTEGEICFGFNDVSGFVFCTTTDFYHEDENFSCCLNTLRSTD